jgi:hypothetical protein
MHLCPSSDRVEAGGRTFPLGPPERGAIIRITGKYDIVVRTDPIETPQVPPHTLTWTFGVRDTYISNPLNPHNAVARLAGSFDSISHDVNQPLNHFRAARGNLWVRCRANGLAVQGNGATCGWRTQRNASLLLSPSHGATGHRPPRHCTCS